MPNIIIYGREEYETLQKKLPNLPDFDDVLDFSISQGYPIDYFIIEDVMGTLVIGNTIENYKKIHGSLPQTLSEYLG